MLDFEAPITKFLLFQIQELEKELMDLESAIEALKAMEI